MSSKQEIKILYSEELVNTQQYQIVKAIKQTILNEIAIPNIQSQIVYTFLNPLTEYDLEVVKICMLLEFGFSPSNISSTSVVINMADFLI